MGSGLYVSFTTITPSSSANSAQLLCLQHLLELSEPHLNRKLPCILHMRVLLGDP